jgi:hypothetical protein
MRFWIAAFAASLAVVSACGMYPPDDGSTNRPATPSPINTGGQPSTIPSANLSPTPAAGGQSAEIEIQITGGDHDGSYRAVAPDACVSTPEQNTYTVIYADDFAQGGFVALNLVLRDAALAQADASSNFLAEISLDGPGGGISVTLDPSADKGEGDAFLDVSPVDATIDMSVIAPDGALIDLTVICDLV